MPHGEVGAPARPPGQLGMEKRLHLGFPSLIPFRRAQGETRAASITCPRPFVTGLRSAAGGWLSCQHPKLCARDTGSLGSLPSAVAAGDAGGGEPQTRGPRPGARDDGLECTGTSEFGRVVTLFPGVECALRGRLVPKLPRARRGLAVSVVFVSLLRRDPWDSGLSKASTRPRGVLGGQGCCLFGGEAKPLV